jgi:hypothetical protein
VKPVSLFRPDVPLSPVASARHLGFGSTTNFFVRSHIVHHQILCFHVRDLKRIWPNLHGTTDYNIATAVIHSTLDYCNSISKFSWYNRLYDPQLFLILLFVFVTKTSKFHNITPVSQIFALADNNGSKKLRIKNKCVLSNKPIYLRNLLHDCSKQAINYRPTSTTRSISVINNSQTSYNNVPSWNFQPFNILL